MAKPRKIIELRDKQSRDTNSRCVCVVVVCIRWIGEGSCVEERQTARVRKKSQKIQNVARFGLPLNAGSPCVREKNQNPFP